MQELWAGSKSANQAPVVERLLVDGRADVRRSFTAWAGLHRAEIRVCDLDSDSLTYRWELKPRARLGTDYIGVPRPALPGLLTRTDTPVVRFWLPKPGVYLPVCQRV